MTSLNRYLLGALGALGVPGCARFGMRVRSDAAWGFGVRGLRGGCKNLVDGEWGFFWGGG